jgi:sugar lactone lactonase YvrE
MTTPGMTPGMTPETGPLETPPVNSEAVPAPEEPAAPAAAAGQEESPNADIGAAGAVAGSQALPEDPEERKRRRRKAALLLLLASLLGVFVLFTGWYLINRKPVTEILPPVTLEELPHYAFSIYGVTAPTGVAVNADGSRIYATQTEGDPQVIAFDGSGKPIATLKPPATSTGDHVPVYVAVNPTNGDVYISDRPAGKVFVYAPDGGYRRTFDPGPALEGWAPLGLGFDAKGDLFVTSVGAPFQAVHEFGPDGTFIRTFGEPNLFSFPNGVSVDAAGNVYVTDSNNGRLFVFGPDGNRLAVGQRGAAAGDLALPRGTAIDDLGRVYVADVTVQGIQVYQALATGERQPRYIGRFGVEGTGDGAFKYPNDVAADGRARLYVADWRNNRIQVWSY